jgi:hypothetical protein
MKSLSPTTNAQRTKEKLPANSHLESMLTGLTTRLFNNKSLTRRDFSPTRQPASSTTNISPRETTHGPDNPSLQQQISHLERLLTGFTTHLFDSKTLITVHKPLTSLHALITTLVTFKSNLSNLVTCSLPSRTLHFSINIINIP